LLRSADRSPNGQARRWRAVFVASAGVFLALALLVLIVGFLPGERALYDAIAGWAGPPVVSTFRVINYLGDKQILLPATLLLLALAPPGARRRWWLWAGVMVLAPILEGLGKALIERPRPLGNAFGFPSGHVTAASAYYFLAAYLLGKRFNHLRGQAVPFWITAAIAVALVAMARIVLQAHWPADALGGAALGLACVSLAAWWHERQEARAGPEAAAGQLRT
jgi:membrane-associated phospholipid phosphatase